MLELQASLPAEGGGRRRAWSPETWSGDGSALAFLAPLFDTEGDQEPETC